MYISYDNAQCDINTITQFSEKDEKRLKKVAFFFVLLHLVQ